MTQVGKTLLTGHGLSEEGRPAWRSDGRYDVDWRRRWPRETHARCECGALSPKGISQYAAKRWHREHKDSLR